MIAAREVQLYAHSIGRAAREMRESLGLTVMALAKRSGVSWAHIYRLERGALSDRARGAGRNGTTVGTLIRLARAMGVTPRELLP